MREKAVELKSGDFQSVVTIHASHTQRYRRKSYQRSFRRHQSQFVFSELQLYVSFIWLQVGIHVCFLVFIHPTETDLMPVSSVRDAVFEHHCLIVIHDAFLARKDLLVVKRPITNQCDAEANGIRLCSY